MQIERDIVQELLEQDVCRLEFWKEILRNLGQNHVYTIHPFPPSNSKRSSYIIIKENCASCGLAFGNNELEGFSMLKCKHPYHIFYFAHLCGSRDTCMYSGCNQVFVQDARQMCQPLIAKRSLLIGICSLDLWLALKGGNLIVGETMFNCFKIDR